MTCSAESCSARFWKSHHDLKTCPLKINVQMTVERAKIRATLILVLPCAGEIDVWYSLLAGGLVSCGPERIERRFGPGAVRGFPPVLPASFGAGVVLVLEKASLKEGVGTCRSQRSSAKCCVKPLCFIRCRDCLDSI